MTIKIITVMLIGLGAGLAVGAGFVAILTVFGIIPRLMQITKTNSKIRSYEISIITGVLFSSWYGLRDYTISSSQWLLIPIGLASGTFIGMLAAALTEVLNVLPVLMKRVGFKEQVLILLMAILFGKVIGSLFHWIFFVHL
ncbi:stage V sporulation protein AB [Pseudalkalibacillus salsuginis]|uniref:stage V sporulation protein AB n=1 Tax=Pseudalkalibacillus salsuginis TaxID=2910972 RepID=UPI001F3E11DE|nr:stage V sporulation protein AB [Pseudalkalibacillus salsuginis]MCF6408298.1 stage V sporulation protein AB [Pseudalkalibacillus salsuginis]